VEIIVSILFFLVFLAFSEMNNIQLSAAYYEFGIMSEFCVQNTYNTLNCALCISLFLGRTPCPLVTLSMFGFIIRTSLMKHDGHDLCVHFCSSM
jgi:hypothetical protein